MLTVIEYRAIGTQLWTNLPMSRVCFFPNVLSFNTLGVGNIANLQFGSETASTFICGDDEEAKSVVRSLGEDIGFDVVDTGPLSNARLLEPLPSLWIYLAYKQGMGSDIAFKLLRR